MTYSYKPNLKKRFLASFIDYSLIMAFNIYYMVKFGNIVDNHTYKIEGWLGLPILIIWFFYFVIIETYYGATLGHKALDLLVLTENRRKIGFKEALKRHLLDPIDFFLYGIPAIIAIKYTEKKQRLGDLWANTIVVDITDSNQYTTNSLYDKAKRE